MVLPFVAAPVFAGFPCLDYLQCPETQKYPRGLGCQ